VKLSRFAIVSSIAVGTLMIVSSVTFAAKPVLVMEWSNGFPSGPHFNLNIHGKADGYTWDSEPGGGSVFVPEHGTSEIQLIQNKKSNVSELTVLDKCGDAFDGDPAKVQLPKGEYQVYARILAKPTKNDEPANVTFYPKLVEACDDATTYHLNGDGIVDVDDLYLIDTNSDGVVDEFDNPDLNGDGIVDDADVEYWLSAFGGLTECTDSDLLGLGVVTTDGAFLQDGQSLERTKGKSTATDITQMFMWEGIAFNSSLDLSGPDGTYDGNGVPDGNLTIEDLVSTDINGDGAVDGEVIPSEHDLNSDSSVSAADFDIWLGELEAAGLYKDYAGNPVWVFDIADLVVYGWDYENNGSKLVQVRFYPTNTTDFVE